MKIISELRTLTPSARRLVTMKFLTNVGLVASYFIGILGTLVYALGGDAFYTAWTVGLINAMEVVGSLAAGAIVDALGPRRHFRICVACIVISSVSFPLLSTSPVGVLVGAGLFGFSWGMGDPIMRTYPAYLTDDLGELKTINAAMNTVIATAVVVGPLLGSGIAEVAPTQAVLALPAAGALLALIPAAGFVPVRDPRAEAEGEGETAVAAAPARGTDDEHPSPDGSSDNTGANSPLAGLRIIAASGTLRLLAISGFLAFFAYGAFDPLEILYYKEVLHVGTGWIGVLSSAAGAGAFLGGLLLMRVPERHANLRTFLLCVAIEGIGCVIYVGTGSVWVALVGQLILGVANGAFNPLQVTLVQVHAPLDSVGRVSSVIGFAYTAAGVIPLLLAPVLANAIGVQATLVASGASVAVIPLALLVLLHRRISASVAEERARKAEV